MFEIDLHAFREKLRKASTKTTSYTLRGTLTYSKFWMSINGIC
ncbi:MAG: hypothetical protein ACLUDU_00255 [Butyricimonas faecihominis]